MRASAPVGTDWVGFYACTGETVGEDLVRDADGNFSVQWDTQMAGCANGTQEIDAYAYTNAGALLGSANENVNVYNAAPPPPPPPPPTPCTADATPAPIAGQGYTQRFGDCFDVLNRSVWCSHQWWEPAPPADSQTVDASGILHLARRRSEGYADTTMSTEPCGQANPKSFQYGYFEARMKWDGAVGNGPGWWLFSTRHATNPAWPSVNPYCASNGLPTAQCWSAELDVFEGYGSHTDVYTGTLHRNSCGCYGVSDRQTGNSWQPMGFDMTQWHVLAAKWTPTQISWYVDGNLVMNDPPYDSTPQPMHMLLYNWTTDWQDDNQVGPSTPNTLDTQVDWVRVWQQ